MILSASRRTDIPAYYSEWLINRLKAGYVSVRNPMNHSQVRKIIISPDVVDCIVFWTKDPQNMLDKLDTIETLGYKYYFQFTITPYDKSIEKGLRDKEEIIKTFQNLSDKIGKEKVLWRYDPIILNDRYDFAFHKEQFSLLCSKLGNYTSQCTISFVDQYARIRSNLLREISDEEMIILCEFISSTARNYGIVAKACCEKPFLIKHGIEQASCIDKNLLEKNCGYHLKIKSDKNQRDSCGCFESIDIGVYNTCKNGCLYCYANYSKESVCNNCLKHNPEGELLIGNIGENERVIIKDVKSDKL